MKTRLQYLYALQQVDSELDELHELKGNLPSVVKELEGKLKEKKDALATLETGVKKQRARRLEVDGDIMELKEKVEKYRQQQFQIKTNKQYDALTREIEQAQEKIAKLEKELADTEGNVDHGKADAEALTPEIETIEEELAERTKELKAVNKEHEEEELKLKHKREKVAVKLSKSDSRLYERIRKAKDGKAIVGVTRNSCGGCFHRVPPQLVLELRKHDQLIACEHCGRILVSDEVVEASKELL